VRIVIGEDEALLREGLVLMLERAGFDVVDVVADATALIEAAEVHRPDLVLSDIRMPPTHTDDGLRAAIAIRSAHPGTPVMLISQYVQRRYALELVSDDPGGIGYLLKQRITDVRTFCEDLRAVGAGGTVLDPEVVAAMMDRSTRGRAMDRLTPRQREVLAAIAQGQSNAAIARSLSITEKAVVQHTSHIYDELDLPLSEESHRRVLAVLRYLAE
jgi:DNA-binding NarL/FixJ family response regulator